MKAAAIMPPMMKLLVGLGNPGPEYEHTRHNAGVWWVQTVAARLGVRMHMEKGFHGQLGRANIQGRPVFLLLPQTYMNLSGQSVAALAQFYKIAPDNMLVVHDELDLPPGQAKLKKGGGHAGHNGLKDIATRLGSADFWRLRLGIGHPGVRHEVAAYVLRKPPAEEWQAIQACMDHTLQALDDLLKGSMESAMRSIHGKPARPSPASHPSAPSAPSSPATPSER
jgi:PTH1 family peptidyl-tRNA hydrolase